MRHATVRPARIATACGMRKARSSASGRSSPARRLWSGSAGSWEDLSLALPGIWSQTYAHGGWSDGSNLIIAGWGLNATLGRYEAFLWTRPLCRADFNHSGGPTPLTGQDIFDFLAAWFVLNPRADFNGVGGITAQDIFDFLAAWFAGC